MWYVSLRRERIWNVSSRGVRHCRRRHEIAASLARKLPFICCLKAASVAFGSQDEGRIPVGRPPLHLCPCTGLMSCNRSISLARNPQILIVLHLHTTCVSAGTSHNVTLRWSTVYSIFLFEANIRLVRGLAASSLLPTFAFFNLLPS